MPLNDDFSDLLDALDAAASGYFKPPPPMTWLYRKPGGTWRELPADKARFLIAEMWGHPDVYEGFQVVRVETRVVGAGEEA